MRKRLFEGLVATLPIASLASCGDATTTTKTKETTTIETTTETKETTTATTTEVPTTTMPETTTVAPTPTTTNPVVVEPLDLSLDLSTDSFKGDKDDKTIHFYHNYGDSYTEIIDQA
jgi:sirohydrochlorin ferrochelatase